MSIVQYNIEFMEKKKIGLICDIDYDHHILFKNYYYALTSLYKNIKIVKDVNDLYDIEMLIIANDHFESHKIIWKNDLFINCVNTLDLKVVVFSTERIMDSFFPWNVDNQRNLEKFKNLYQYVLVDDINKLNKKHHRCLISKFYKNIVNIPDEKINKAIFIGSTNSHSYINRIELLSKIGKILPIDIIDSKNDNWIDYIKTLSKYRFVFSPMGNMDGFPLRFYETLLVKSIPIQQINPIHLSKYDIESKFDDCIFFYTVEELDEKIKNFNLTRSYNELWLEDHIEELLKNDNLI